MYTQLLSHIFIRRDCAFINETIRLAFIYHALSFRKPPRSQLFPTWNTSFVSLCLQMSFQVEKARRRLSTRMATITISIVKCSRIPLKLTRVTFLRHNRILKSSEAIILEKKTAKGSLKRVNSSDYSNNDDAKREIGVEIATISL